jgi:predicted lysophospholipase L1 biosynthesis ABC-type transport system permease subunit
VPEETGFEGTREEMDRAIRRLNVLEYLILAAAVVVALLGGAFVAFVLSTGTELPFRLTWGVASVFLLVVPGLAVLMRERREDRRRSNRTRTRNSDGA